MMREWKLRFLPAALAAFVAAGCGDGTEPQVEDFEADVVSAAAEAVLAPAQASADAQHAVLDFMISVLGGGGSFDRQPLASDRGGLAQRISTSPLQPSFARTFAVAEIAADIPPELYGQTWVWDPATGQWAVDESRAGPSNGVRVIWYLTDSAGYIVPLQEQGYVDMVNQTVQGMDGVALTIVRTVGGNTTLADVAQAYEYVETASGYTERFVMDGYLSDGTKQVDVSADMQAQGNSSTLDEAVAVQSTFEGPEGTYTWDFTSTSDSGSSESSYAASITRGSDVTKLELTYTGTDMPQTGTGHLLHNGGTVANVAADDGGFTFTKPAGGTFTSQENSSLQGLTYAMMFYAPFVLSAFLFIAIA